MILWSQQLPDMGEGEMCVLQQACMTQACSSKGTGVTQTLQPLLGYTEGSVVSEARKDVEQHSYVSRVI